MRSGRADGNKAAHFRPAHQHLHADISAEGIAQHPLGRRVRINRLQEIQPRTAIRNFANAAIITALAASHAAQIEAQHRKAQRLHTLVQRMDHTVIHRPAMERVRMQQQRRGGIRALGMVVASFKPAIRPGEHHFWHGLLSYPFHSWPVRGSPPIAHGGWAMQNPAAPAPHFRETKTHEQDTHSSLNCRTRKS